MTTDQTTRDRVTIAAYRTSTGATQIQIVQLDDKDSGWGHRLAGPKHHNMGTETLVERTLDADDAREMRNMLDAAFPQQAPPAAQPDPEFPATWTGGHALVIEYGDEELHARCQCGEQLGVPQTPAMPIDAFARPWEQHVMTLGR